MRVIIVGGGLAGTFVGSLLLINNVDFIMVDTGLQIPKAPLIHSKLLRIPSDVELAHISEDVYNELSQYFNTNLMVDFPSLTIIPGTCLNETRRLMTLWSSVGAKVEVIDWDSNINKVTDDEVMVKSINGDHLVNIRELMNRLRRNSHYIKGLASLKMEDGEVKVLVNNETLKGDYVVLTTGAWNTLNVRSLNLDLPLQPYKCQAAAFLTKKLSYIVYDYVVGMYMRPLNVGFPSSRITIAGDGNSKVNEIMAKDRVDPRFKREIIEKIRRRLGLALPLASRYGYCELTPDTMPIVGPWRINGFYVLGGFDGYGAEVGPALARALVNHILNGVWYDYAKPYLTSRFTNGWPKSWGTDVEAHELCVD